MDDNPNFIISKEDWSLHRKGYEDQARHQEKVKEAIKKNLPDLITEENVILSNGRDIVKIPIRSLDEYRFRYNHHKQKHAGQGEGDSQVGDVVARDGKPSKGPGKGQGAGDKAGDDYYEAEIDVEQLQEMLFSELELPYLKQKERDQITVEDIRFNDIRKKGLMGNVDKKRTILSAIKRNAMKGHLYNEVNGKSQSNFEVNNQNNTQRNNQCNNDANNQGSLQVSGEGNGIVNGQGNVQGNSKGHDETNVQTKGQKLSKQHKKYLYQISVDDLRFKTWEEIVQPHSNAVIIAMMDTSGSMGVFEKFCARSFFFWMVRFLRTKYDKVEIVFIAHHTEAKEVTEHEFFYKGESGGTICSSAYRKALEIIDARYSPDRYNIYPIHFSDGDNLTSDNNRCLKLVKELMNRSNLFGYGEVNQYNRNSTLMSAYKHIQDPRFRYSIIKEKRQVFDALKTIFHKDDQELAM